MGTRITYNDTPLKVGMTLSNEPGFYLDGKFGIRIEDVVVVKEVKTPNNFGEIGYLGFENLTMVGCRVTIIVCIDLRSSDTICYSARYKQD
jgi:Xaa-Pro aminopeptidase